MSDTPQTDCVSFSGYKPCGKNDVCSPRCPQKQVALPRILIIHLEAMGAVLRGTVLLSSIKRKWPQAHVTWITNPATAPLLEHNPLIHRLLRNDHGGCLALSTLSFDYTFCVDKSLTAAGLMNIPVACGVRRGFGVESATGSIIPLNPEAQRLYELGLSNREKFFVNQTPENRLLVEALGMDFKNDPYVFEFTDEERNFIRTEKSRLGLQGKIAIGLNTGCSGVIPYKKLTIPGWGDLISVLKARFPHAAFLLLGGPEDTVRNREISRRLPGELIETPTDEGLRKGMAYLDLCDAIVTGDSLGLHMAIALKKWVVCWFGPTCAHEIDFYGCGAAVKTKAACSPCWKRECHNHPMCYEQVQWQEIAEALARGLPPLNSKIPSDEESLHLAPPP